MKNPLIHWKITLPGISAKEKWIRYFVNLLGKDEDDMTNYLRFGIRDAAIRFEYPLGTYMGGWKDCSPHGRGLFFSSNGVRFDGEWNSNLNSGFGFVSRMDNSQKKNKEISDEKLLSGWKHNFPHENGF